MSAFATAAGSSADGATATAPKISPPRKRWVLPPDGVVVAASDSPPRTNPLLQRRSSLDGVPPLLRYHDYLRNSGGTPFQLVA